MLRLAPENAGWGCGLIAGEMRELESARSGCLAVQRIPKRHARRLVLQVAEVAIARDLFGQIVVTTEGGPGYRTMTVAYYIYWLGVKNNRQGYASAVSFVMFVAMMLVAAVQVAMMRRRQVTL